MSGAAGFDLHRTLLASMGACLASIEADENIGDVAAEDWITLNRLYEQLLNIAGRASGVQHRTEAARGRSQEG